MEFLLTRFRNFTILLVVTVAQLILIAYQVKTSNEVPLLRVWVVTAVTPVIGSLEWARRGVVGFFQGYIFLIETRQQDQRLQRDIARLKLENQYLRNALVAANHEQVLAAFQSKLLSKTLQARIIGNGTGANSKSVFLDKGTNAGVQAGMALITADGIVGKVIASYPTASMVLLITDANFAASVISQKNRIRGTLKGSQGHAGAVLVEYIPNEEKVDIGEWFYTSGEDRIFPKGLRVGRVLAVKNGRSDKEVVLNPSGLVNGLEEVLVVLEAVHQPIPENDEPAPTQTLIPPPPADTDENAAEASQTGLPTDADRMREIYRKAGDAQHHVFGQGNTPPDFTKMQGLREGPPAANKPPVPAGASTPVSPTPGATGGATPGTPTGTTPITPAAAPPATGAGAGAVPLTVPTTATRAKPAVTAEPLPPPKPLVTDPTDADPSDPAVAAPPPPKPKMKPDGQIRF